ncbi:MAG: hypothetical protein COZ18_14985 [Flexibacter sp. CG_4_10_14_3_um_filter_32_15]|nr:MAG: hypothetical protein COZ18_14985 [Flexibacter sp. CG_4_10_14_3_um_filter_32_15]
MLKRLLKLFYGSPTKYKHPAPVERVQGVFFEDKPLYKFKNPKDIPLDRVRLFQHYYPEYLYGISPNYINEILDSALEAMDLGEPSEAAFRIKSLQSVLGSVLPIDSVYGMAALYFFTEDENSESIDVAITQKKINEFRKTEDPQFFFAQQSEIWSALGLKSLKDVENFLQNGQKRMTLFRQVLLKKRENKEVKI